MTTPSPSSAEMQKLLEELEHRCNPKRQTGNEDLFLEKEGPTILAYIRTLEKEHREMREAIEEVQSWGHSDDCTVDDDDDYEHCFCCGKLFAKVLSFLTLKP